MINKEKMEEALDAIEIDLAAMQDFELLEAIGFIRTCFEDYETLIETLIKENKELKLQLK